MTAALRGLGLLLLVGLDAALLLALLRDRPLAILHPVAPPLTRLDALGDHPLASGQATPPNALRRAVDRVIAATGDADQRMLSDDVRASESALTPLRGRAGALRHEVTADALAIAGVLGPERLAAVVAARESLARSVGETAVWAELETRLQAR